jgi:hypothetical protein
MMKVIKIFWSDLTPSKQEEMLELLGDNRNYDVFPLTIIEYEDSSIDTQGVFVLPSNSCDAVDKEILSENNL